MKAEEITTIEKLAEIINNAEEWLVEFNSIIAINGWNDETSEEFGICSDGTKRLVFDQDAKAVVIDID